ncbi:MAG: methyltransferase domain-containing protein [Thermodesulfobacteriota bacterium]
MEVEEYEIMFRMEEEHWWYMGLHRLVMQFLARGPRSGPLKILDAGCGTGKLMERFIACGHHVTGIDCHPEAMRFSCKRGVGPLVRGSVRDMPFRSDMFDMAVSLDVLYAMQPSEAIQALAEMRRVLKPGGDLILNLPAFEFLYSTHDVAVHTKHRYTRSEIRTALEYLGFSLELITYRNALLFLPAALVRIIKRYKSKAGHRVGSDLALPPPLVNKMLSTALSLENSLFGGGMSLPAGLSVFCLARKPMS